jgi:hypothetical protein
MALGHRWRARSPPGRGRSRDQRLTTATAQGNVAHPRRHLGASFRTRFSQSSTNGMRLASRVPPPTTGTASRPRPRRFGSKIGIAASGVLAGPCYPPSGTFGCARNLPRGVQGSWRPLDNRPRTLTAREEPMPGTMSCEITPGHRRLRARHDIHGHRPARRIAEPSDRYNRHRSAARRPKSSRRRH